MSEIRSILLHLDATLASPDRLTLTHALAERLGARITALFGASPDSRQVGYAYSAAAALAAAAHAGEAHDREHVRLREWAADRQLECDWCDARGDSLLHGFLAEAVYADLLVLGAPVAPHDDSRAASGAFVEAAILQSGVPALVVPSPHRQETIGDRVVVAWDASLPSARALKAALPLLRGASRVHVATWGPHAPPAPFSGMDVHAWLRRHGVAGHVLRFGAVAKVATAIASLAAEERADLVVMGCYGHAPLREQMFGGVTRSSLARSSVPVLMAH